MAERNSMTKRFLVMCFGIVIMGLGVAIFKMALVGNDPFNSLVMGLDGRFVHGYTFWLVLVNAVCMIAPLLMDRKMIGAGTLANWFAVGPLVVMWSGLIDSLNLDTNSWAIKVPMMVVGVLILSLSVSLYQTANLGIAPYDTLSILMDRHLPLPYFWCRIITDVACAGTAYMLGGLVSVGTLVCAFGLGPFISFYNRTVTAKILPSK